MKKLILIIMIASIMLLSVGCWDVQDIDELYLPTIISFDYNNKTHTYNINSAIMNFTNGKDINEFLELKKDSISESVEAVQKTTSKEISMSLLQAIVLGEEFSKNSTYNLVNWLYKEDINSNVSMCIYQGEAKELIDKLKPNEEENKTGQSSEQQSKSKSSKKDSNDKISCAIKLISSKNQEGYEVLQSLKEFTINNENEAKTALLPTIVMKDEIPTIVGTTVFKNYNNIGFVDSNDTKYLMLLRGLTTSGTTNFENLNFENKKTTKKPNIFDKNSIDEISKVQSSRANNFDGVVEGFNKRKVKLERINGKYVFNIIIDIECNILENNNSTLNLITNEENIKLLEDYLNKKLENECNKFIAKVKDGINQDVFDLTKYANVKYSEEISDLKDENFFNKSEIKVKVNTKLKNTSLFN